MKRIQHTLKIACLTAIAAFTAQHTTAQNLERGKAVYEQHCASCHGRDLNGGNAQSMIDGVWLHGSGAGNLRRNISLGISASGMPDYQNALSRQDISAVVAYILDEERKADPPPKTLPERLLTRHYDVAVEPWVAEGLDAPWGMTFLDSDTALVTEKPGGLRIIKNGELDPKPIQGLPKVFFQVQGGMLDVAIDPDYPDNGWIYLCYSAAHPQQPSRAMTRVIRGKIDGHQWTDQELLWEVPVDKPQHWAGSGFHFGSRIAFDNEGYLYFAHGERGDMRAAQDLARPHGKIHRIHRDGTIPKDNPFLDNPDAMPSIWSYGHRNPQGLALHPTTGELWESEHGPLGGDEVNIIKPGNNYGWPITSYGINYNGQPVTDEIRREGITPPVQYWVPSIAICGIEFCQGEAFPHWNNNLLVGGLGYEELRRLVVEDGRVIHQELLLKNAGRVRDVCVGPDGTIYAVLNKPDKIIRLTNAGAALRQ